jgi:hypothetical protein
MKYYRKKIEEDAPTNNVGSGAIAGVGVGPQGEPGISSSVMNKHRRRNKKNQESNSIEVNLFRRKTPMTEEVNTGSFAGSTTFIVPSNIFLEAKFAKRKGKHWRKYIGENDALGHIREYAMKNPKKAIVLQDENTGAMCYARYGKK